MKTTPQIFFQEKKGILLDQALREGMKYTALDMCVFAQQYHERQTENEEIKQQENLCKEIKLEVIGDKILTKSYYNECFVEKARNLKGSWTGSKWQFDLKMENHVKKALIDCYGVDGTEPYETVVILVKNWTHESRRSGIELLGRPICKAFGRDTGAKAQDGIYLLEGKFTSGGSVKNWSTVTKDATFEIHDFPSVRLQDQDVQNLLLEEKIEICQK